MDDLENAILTAGDGDFMEKEPENLINLSSKPLRPHFGHQKKTEFVLALLEDGFYIGQVEDIKGEELQLNVLLPKNKSTDERKFWVWPDREDKDWINRDCIMEIYLSLRIETKLSTNLRLCMS